MARSKRGNLEGSVFQLQDGSWRGFITMGRDSAGKQVKRWRRGKTQKDVTAKLNKIRHLSSSDLVQRREKLTVEEWLRRVYEIKRTKVKPKTLQSYEQYQRKILPERGVAQRWDDHDLIFPSAAGTPVHYRNFRRTYLRLVEEAGVPLIRIHDHRHTYITMARDAGLDAEVIANRVGHDVRMTLALYSNITDDRKKKAT